LYASSTKNWPRQWGASCSFSKSIKEEGLSLHVKRNA
jgi:hypothetical protein